MNDFTSFTKEGLSDYLIQHNFELTDTEKESLGRKCTFVLFRVFVDSFMEKPTNT